MFNFIKNLFFGKNEELENKGPKEPKIQQIDIDHLESDLREKDDKIRERDKTILLLEEQIILQESKIKYQQATIQEQRDEFISSRKKITKNPDTKENERKNTREKETIKKENRLLHEWEQTLRNIILPNLKNLPNARPFPENSYNKIDHWYNDGKKYIMIDASAIFFLANDDSDFDIEKLKKMLNQITSSSIFTPIMTEELVAEWKNVIKKFLPKKNTWLEKFPVPAINTYIQRCYFEPSNQKYTTKWKKWVEDFNIQLSEKEKAKLAETEGEEFDIIHAAKALSLGALFVTEDSGLLRLKNNPSFHLKSHPLYTEVNNYNIPINELIEIEQKKK